MVGYHDLLDQEDLEQMIEDCGFYAGMKILSVVSCFMPPEKNLPRGEAFLRVTGTDGQIIEIYFIDPIKWKLDYKPIDGFILIKKLPMLPILFIWHPDSDEDHKIETSSWFMAKSIYWRIVPDGE